MPSCGCAVSRSLFSRAPALFPRPFSALRFASLARSVSRSPRRGQAGRPLRLFARHRVRALRFGPGVDTCRRGNVGRRLCGVRIGAPVDCVAFSEMESRFRRCDLGRLSSVVARLSHRSADGAVQRGFSLLGGPDRPVLFVFRVRPFRLAAAGHPGTSFCSRFDRWRNVRLEEGRLTVSVCVVGWWPGSDGAPRAPTSGFRLDLS